MNEQEWYERLSAYLDDELGSAERQEIDRVLADDPQRAKQLEELRRVELELHAWKVETPSASLESAARHLSARTQNVRTFRRNVFLVGLRYAAVLAIGVFLGVTLTKSSRSEPGRPDPLPVRSAATLAAVPLAIPAETSESLLREVSLSQKAQRVRSLMREGRYVRAAQEYNAIERDSPGMELLPARFQNPGQVEIELWRAFHQQREI